MADVPFGLSFPTGNGGEAVAALDVLIHLRALAIAVSKVSRLPGFIGVLCAGTCTMPLSGAAAGTVHGMATVVCSAAKVSSSPASPPATSLHR